MTTNGGGEAEPVVWYDGICGFCHGAVQIILRLDHHGRLRIAALDSDFARTVVRRHPELHGVDSVVFVDNAGGPDERVTVRSAAVLRVAQYLGGPYRALLVARLFRHLLATGSTTISPAFAIASSGRGTPAPLPHPRCEPGSLLNHASWLGHRSHLHRLPSES